MGKRRKIKGNERKEWAGEKRKDEKIVGRTWKEKLVIEESFRIAETNWEWKAWKEKTWGTKKVRLANAAKIRLIKTKALGPKRTSSFSATIKWKKKSIKTSKAERWASKRNIDLKFPFKSPSLNSSKIWRS